MASPGGRADPGFYAERAAPRVVALDRALAGLGYGLHAALGRRLRVRARFAQEVARHASRLRAAPLEANLAQLRYRLRRDGLAGERLAECFGAYCAALPPDGDAPGAGALCAAQALVQGGVADLQDADGRWQALALAATAFALCGVPVHLYCASEARARAAADALRAPLRALRLGEACALPGMDAAARRAAYGAAVVCVTQRTLAFDYLRDRLRLGRRQRPLQGRLEQLAGDAPPGAQLMLSGLRCALVEDADLVLIDDARAPLVVSADVSTSADRLLYEQALELARALQPGEDYAREGTALRLSGRGSQRLAQLSLLLGGAWAARQSREDLVVSALIALQVMARGRDYEVAQGALQLAQGEGDAPPPEALQRLLEVKEGLAFAGRREVLTRLQVAEFFRRYLRLAGVCADARGLEREFWATYGLRCASAGALAEPAACPARVFARADQRRGALAAAVRERAARGEAVVVALRDAKEAEAVAGALRDAGVRSGALRGAADSVEQEALAALDQPGAVALSLHPAHRGVARSAAAMPPLHLAVADLHEAARHVAQIARNYAARSCERYLALDDESVAARLGPAARRVARAASGGGELPAAAAQWVARAAQRGAERAAARERASLATREQSLEDLLAFSGRAD